MGDCKDYGALLGTLRIRGRIIIRNPPPYAEGWLVGNQGIYSLWGVYRGYVALFPVDAALNPKDTTLNLEPNLGRGAYFAHPWRRSHRSEGAFRKQADMRAIGAVFLGGGVLTWVALRNLKAIIMSFTKGFGGVKTLLPRSVDSM